MKNAFRKFHEFLRSALDILIAAPIRWVFARFGKEIKPPWWKRKNP